MRKVTIFTIAAFLLVLCAMPVYADGVPSLPHAFYGNVTINGAPALAGTTVEARGEGVRTGLAGNPVVTTEVGKYGSATSPALDLIVQGDIVDGAIITFHVNGVSTGQTAAWHSGETTELDLAVTIITEPPTVTTNAATGIGTTTATLNGSLTNLGSAPSAGVSFEWGTSTSYDNETTPQTMTATGEFSASLSGLSSGTTYHFRAKAVGEGTSYGIDRTFTTSAPAAPPAPPAPPEEEAPPTEIYVETNLFGTTASISISSEGEILETITATSADGMLTLTIEAGTTALLGDEPLESLEASIDESPPDPPEGAHVIGAFDFGPDGATFDPPITLTWNYDPEDVPENMDLVIAYYDEDEGDWVYLPVERINNTLTASVSHFTTFALIAVPKPAAFALSSLIVEPTEVAPDEKVNISISVANTGGREGRYTVVLEINGVKEAEKAIRIAPGESQEVSFSVARKEAGSYSVAIDGLSGSFTVVAPPVEPEPVEPEPVEPEPVEPEPVIEPEPTLPVPEPEPEPTNWPLIGGIIAAAIVVGLIIFFLVRRRAQ